MRLLCLFPLVLFAACSAAEPEQKPLLKEFRDMHFGIHFSHSNAITTTYAPHGRAALIPINWKGKIVGALHILSLPPTSDDEIFASTGKSHFKKQFDAISVDHRFYENPSKYKFHVFTLRSTRDGTNYTIELYTHIRRSKPATPAQEILAQQFGSFEFEFFSPDADFPALKSEIQTIVDTFKLE